MLNPLLDHTKISIFSKEDKMYLLLRLVTNSQWLAMTMNMFYYREENIFPFCWEWNMGWEVIGKNLLQKLLWLNLPFPESRINYSMFIFESFCILFFTNEKAFFKLTCPPNMAVTWDCNQEGWVSRFAQFSYFELCNFSSPKFNHKAFLSLCNYGNTYFKR